MSLIKTIFQQAFVMGLLSGVFNFLYSCSDGKPGMLAKAGYHMNGDKVYYFGGISSGPAKELNGADPKSFKSLDEQGFPEGSYGKDKQRVYFEEILNEEIHCGRDKKQAYHWDVVIPNTDPATFPNGKRCKSCTNEKIVFED